MLSTVIFTEFINSSPNHIFFREICLKKFSFLFITDSSHIVDGKLKLILGLIWTLILHYSISMPMWDEDDFDDTTDRSKQTPKQRLLAWVQNKVPDKPIKNFTQDWNDGTAIGALVDAIAPGKSSNCSKCSSRSADPFRKNCRKISDF